MTNFADFFLFADAFGGTDPRFDLDGSGVVDFGDFFIFADAFGQPARAKLLALAAKLIGLPEGPQLQQNAPNPFNSQTVIPYFLLAPGQARLEVFALTGQRVAVSASGPPAGGSAPPPLGRPRRGGASSGQRHLPLPAGDGRGGSDPQARAAALVSRRRNMPPLFRRSIPAHGVAFTRRTPLVRLAQAPCEPGASAAQLRQPISAKGH